MCLVLLESCVSCIDYVLAVICLSCYTCRVGVVLLEVGLEIVVWFGIMVGVMLVMFCDGCLLCLLLNLMLLTLLFLLLLVRMQCCIYEGGYIFVVLVGILYRF